MKTISKQFKTAVVMMVLAFSLNLVAQTERNKQVFLRVYNLEGKKMSKGYFKFANNNVLGIFQNRKLVQLNVKEIGYIKTKRSAGNNVLLGSGIGAATFGSIGAATADPDAWIFGYTAGEGAAIGIISGGLAGAAIGGITTIFKNSETYIIDGKIENLQRFANNISIK